MLHYCEHRRLFKDPYHYMGKHMLNFFMCPFFGIPPGFYRLHHVYMHHVENNFFEEDLSSTEPYQRDSFLNYLHYYWTYITLIIKLPLWALYKGHTDIFLQVIVSGTFWAGGTIIGLQYFYIFTLWTMLIPFFCTGMVMMLGNFS